MEILIVRHAEPDYAHDALTDKGIREARLLADRLCKLDVKAFYCSPLGRAQKTASYTLTRLSREAETLPWLTEFEGKIKQKPFIKTHCWDRLPSYWTAYKQYYSYNDWHKVSHMKKGGAVKQYAEVAKGIDTLLEKHGYKHKGKVFQVEKENSDIIVLFCHFAVESVILSHLLHISPMIMWHNFVALPSSVTRIVTQEREKGTAIFTCLQYGDLSHLYCGGEEPSFMARYCEKYSDDTRH